MALCIKLKCSISKISEFLSEASVFLFDIWIHLLNEILVLQEDEFPKYTLYFHCNQDQKIWTADCLTNSLLYTSLRIIITEHGLNLTF